MDYETDFMEIVDTYKSKHYGDFLNFLHHAFANEDDVLYSLHILYRIIGEERFLEVLDTYSPYSDEFLSFAVSYQIIEACKIDSELPLSLLVELVD